MISRQSPVKGDRGLKKYEDLDPESSEMEQDDDEIESNNDNSESIDSASENDQRSKKANPGWADAMQKILKTNKPKRKKTIVLSKAKKLTEVKEKENAEAQPFQIQADSGELKTEVSPKKVEPDKDQEEAIIAKRKKKDTHLGIRVKPSVCDREREIMLQKIATKGVVQLFNVVEQQQLEIERKIIQVGPLERKREQVLKGIDKRAFLDVLMGGSKSIPLEDSTGGSDTKNEEDSKSHKVWSVLRDDFVMAANLKDWDKKAPEEDDVSTSSEEMDSD